MLRHPLLIAFLLPPLALSASPSLAQPTPADRAVAEALFAEALALVRGGKYQEACPKFEESQRVDPGVGTLLYLADCYEKTRRTASAWATFHEAATAARVGNQPDREKIALQHASALLPRLARLTLAVPPGSERPGLQIKRDGKLVGRPLWGSAIPVDPGKYTIEASAPSFRTLLLTVEINEPGQQLTLPIPALEPEASGPPTQASASAPTGAPAATSAPPLLTPPPPALPSSRRTIALVSGGAGLVAVGLGAFFGLQAMSRWSDAKTACPGDRCKNTADVELGQAAQRSGNLSSVLFGVGAAGLGVGAILWFSAPASSSRAFLSPSLSPHGGFLTAGRTW